MSAPEASFGPELVRRLRAETPIIIGHLARRVGDLSVAEDLFQECLASAVEHFRAQGAPENVGAWLMNAAKWRALDWLRRERRERLRSAEPSEELPASDEAEPGELRPDEPLRLMFACCHPKLPLEAQVALTLRCIAGLTTAETARAFLLNEVAAAQRLVRAKKLVAGEPLSLELPEAGAFDERLEAVLLVVYLIFNEGSAAASGPSLTRDSLAAEALRLGALLTELAPGAGGAWALRGLLELHAARFAARADAAGRLVLLEAQDRSRWDRARIQRGLEHLARARALRSTSRYVFEAEISALHATAPRFADTDWGGIVNLYLDYERHHPSPILTLNRAVAVAMRDGPSAALSLLDAEGLDEPLDGYFPYHMARADFERRRGAFDTARAVYTRALELARNEPERFFVQQRLTECEAGAAAAP